MQRLQKLMTKKVLQRPGNKRLVTAPKKVGQTTTETSSCDEVDVACKAPPTKRYEKSPKIKGFAFFYCLVKIFY